MQEEDTPRAGTRCSTRGRQKHIGEVARCALRATGRALTSSEQNTLLGHSAAARLETGLAPRHGAIAAVGRRRHAPVALRRSLRCSAASVDCSAVPRGCQCHYGRSDVPPRPTLPKRMSWIVKVLVDDGVVMFWCVVLFVEYHSIVTWL